MSEWKILVVEDKEAQFDMLKDQLDAKLDCIDFQVIWAQSLEEAVNSLESEDVDCGVIDLKVPSATGEKAQAANGIKIILSSVKNYGIPVVLFSGWPDEVGPALDELPLIQRLSKSDDGTHEKAVEWLLQNKNLIDATKAAKNKILEHSVDVFSKRILHLWDDPRVKALSVAELSGVFTRQMASHTSEQLGLEEPENHTWHPVETYIIPPLRAKKAHTGDIFEMDDGLWVVLSPQCDMATGKTHYILLAKCEEQSLEDWNKQVTGYKEPKSNTSQEKCRRFLSDSTNQAIEVSSHFLPPFLGRGPLLVRYGQTKSMERDEVEKCLDLRVASLSAPFISNLTQRFGAYISRPGQPNIGLDYL